MSRPGTIGAGAMPGRGAILAMAAAGGITVSNIYLYQPLLPAMARDLAAPDGMAALVPFATQLGYGLGVLLIVPLVDIANPPTLLRWLFVLTTVGLLAAAAAPSMTVLLIASVAFATTTVVPQVLMPLAPGFVPPERRGRVIGTLATGFILGILLSRTVSGAVAELSGSWRTSYLVAAALTLSLVFILPGMLPATGRTPGRYRELIGSLPGLLRLRPLLLSAALSSCLFAAFTAFWATLAFHLATPSFGFGPAMAGLFGLFGAPGALATPLVGRLVDRFGSTPVNALSLAAGGIGFLVAGSGGLTSVPALVVAVNLIDFGLQSGQVANRTRIFQLGDGIRGRVNSLFTVTQFIGGALGALASGLAWTRGGWPGVCSLCTGLVGAAALLLIVATLRARRRSR